MPRFGVSVIGEDEDTGIGKYFLSLICVSAAHTTGMMLVVMMFTCCSSSSPLYLPSSVHGEANCLNNTPKGNLASIAANAPVNVTKSNEGLEVFAHVSLAHSFMDAAHDIGTNGWFAFAREHHLEFIVNDGAIDEHPGDLAAFLARNFDELPRHLENDLGVWEANVFLKR